MRYTEFIMKHPLLKHRSATSYVLEGLIPFTDANLNLTFRPSQFFRELEKRSPHKQKSLANAYYRAQTKGIVRRIDGHFAISDKYIQKIHHQVAKKLPDGQIMLVVYDIPENLRNKRRELRSLLTQLEFSQQQRSVWVSSYNHFEPVLALIGALKIKQYVQVYIGSSTFEQYMLY